MSLIEFAQQLPLIFLCILRAYGITLLLPILSGKSLPTMAQSAIALVMSIPIIILHINGEPPPLAFNMTFLFLSLKELVIGLFIGFFAAIPFWAVNTAGFIIDTARGASMATVLDPMMQHENSTFGQLFTYLLTAIFFLGGAFHGLLLGLYETYNIVSLHQGLQFTHGLDLIISQWHLMVDLGLRFTLPSLVCMLMIDLSLGLINRTAQQLNVFILSMPIKSVVVLFVMILSLAVSFSILQAPFNDLYKNITQILEALK